MSNIDLEGFIKTHALNKKLVAQELFPTNSYPELALRRILKGEALMDSDQISKLAALAGVTPGEVFQGAEWTLDFGSPDGQTIILESNDYRAELDRSTWMTKFFYKGSLFHQQIILSPNVSLARYLRELDLIVAGQQFRQELKTK